MLSKIFLVGLLASQIAPTNLATTNLASNGDFVLYELGEPKSVLTPFSKGHFEDGTVPMSLDDPRDLAEEEDFDQRYISQYRMQVGGEFTLYLI